MSLETVTWVGDLNSANPAATDVKSQGDDHMRNIKAALLASFAGFDDGILVSGVDGGAVNAYTLTPANALPAYSTRTIILFSPAVTNTGAATMNISGLGVKSIKSVAGAALVAGDLVAASFYLAVYDGTNFLLLGITKNYADQLAYNTVLPALVANYLLGSDGTTSFFTNLLKDTIIRFANTTDPTKKIAFDASPLSTATTRNITMPDRDVYLGMPYMKVSDTKSSGTAGGASLAADITQTRTLNTSDANTITGASLATNTVTLPAGTYQCRGRAPAHSVANHQILLYNTSDSTYVIKGSTANANAADVTTDSFMSGQFTIAATKNFTMRHYTSSAVATDGLGEPTSSGQGEVYAELEFIKVS